MTEQSLLAAFQNCDGLVGVELGGGATRGARDGAVLFASLALANVAATAKVRGPHQRGLSPDRMALITSDCGAMRSPSTKWP